MIYQVALCQGLSHIAEPNDVIASFQRQLTAALPEGQVPLVLEVHKGLLAVLGQGLHLGFYKVGGGVPGGGA